MSHEFTSKSGAIMDYITITIRRDKFRTKLFDISINRILDCLYRGHFEKA